jgi:hypothetical protein
MPGNILRWKGGAGGDILLKLISFSHANIRTNVKFQEGLTEQGAAVLDFSQLDISKQTDLITKLEHLDDVDPVLLTQQAQALFAGDQIWWLKSHYYAHGVCDQDTIDLVADLPSLPFAVAANINKTKTLTVDFNHIVGNITDSELRYHYSIFSVAKDFVAFETTNRTITVDQLLSGWHSIKHTMQQFGVELDENLKIMYETWRINNQQYLPSPTYKYCVQSQNYDADHPKLNLVEKYCLLAISGSKFKKLQHKA